MENHRVWSETVNRLQGFGPRTPHRLLCGIITPLPWAGIRDIVFVFSLRILRARLVCFLATCLLLCYADLRDLQGYTAYLSKPVPNIGHALEQQM